MEPRVIMLLSADKNLQHATIAAAASNRQRLRLASTVRDTLEVLQSSLDDVDLILLDLDSDICGVMLLHALAFCCERIPVATVTSFDRDYTLPIALSKGAIACLGKPVTKREISALLKRVCGRARPMAKGELQHATA